MPGRRAPLGGTGVQLQWQPFYGNVSLISNSKGLSPEKISEITVKVYAVILKCFCKILTEA